MAAEKMRLQSLHGVTKPEWILFSSLNVSQYLHTRWAWTYNLRASILKDYFDMWNYLSAYEKMAAHLINGFHIDMGRSFEYL